MQNNIYKPGSCLNTRPGDVRCDKQSVTVLDLTQRIIFAHRLGT